MCDIKVCRICLRSSNIKLYGLAEFNLQRCYEGLHGQRINIKDGLPCWFCYECAALLHKFHKFKEKLNYSQKAFKKLLKSGLITHKSINTIRSKNENIYKFGTLDIVSSNDKVKTFKEKHFSVNPQEIKDDNQSCIRTEEVVFDCYDYIYSGEDEAYDDPEYDPVAEEEKVDINEDIEDKKDILETHDNEIPNPNTSASTNEIELPVPINLDSVKAELKHEEPLEVSKKLQQRKQKVYSQDGDEKYEDSAIDELEINEPLVASKNLRPRKQKVCSQDGDEDEKYDDSPTDELKTNEPLVASKNLRPRKQKVCSQDGDEDEKYDDSPTDELKTNEPLVASKNLRPRKQKVCSQDGDEDEKYDDSPIDELKTNKPLVASKKLQRKKQKVCSQDYEDSSEVKLKINKPLVVPKKLRRKKQKVYSSSSDDEEEYEEVQPKRKVRKSNVISPETKKYKFKSRNGEVAKMAFLNNSFWKKTSLSEEEVSKEFEARSQNRKYLNAAFKCTDCFKGFSKKVMLDRHKLLRHGEAAGPLTCRFCNMRFKSSYFINKHMRQHYTKYECLRCNLVCNLENSALFHEEYHNGVIRKCTHCNKEFRHMSSFYTHLRTHRSKHMCSLCGESFVSELGLRLHKNLKHVVETENHETTIEESYCETCQIKFETKEAFDKHLLHSAMHTDNNKLLDDDVAAEYLDDEKDENDQESEPLIKRRSRVEKSLSVVRKFSSTGRTTIKKPTTCYQCNKRFETQSACMKHHLAMHPGTSFFSEKERIICEVCGASLAPGSVAAHQNRHTRSKMFTCDTCGKSFTATNVLRNHMAVHTGEKKFACSQCDKRFTQAGSLSLHYRTFHLKQPYPKRSSDFPQSAETIINEERKPATFELNHIQYIQSEKDLEIQNINTLTPKHTDINSSYARPYSMTSSIFQNLTFCETQTTYNSNNLLSLDTSILKQVLINDNSNQTQHLEVDLTYNKSLSQKESPCSDNELNISPPDQPEFTFAFNSDDSVLDNDCCPSDSTNESPIFQKVNKTKIRPRTKSTNVTKTLNTCIEVNPQMVKQKLQRGRRNSIGAYDCEKTTPAQPLKRGSTVDACYYLTLPVDEESNTSKQHISQPPRKRKKYATPLHQRKQEAKNKIKNKHLVKPGCKEKCLKKCMIQFNQEEREAINKVYWDMSWQEQHAFVEASTCVAIPKRKITSEPKRNPKRTFWLKNQENIRVEVCKVFFLTTLGYKETNDRILYPTFSDPSMDKRGKHQKTPAFDRDLLNQHVDSFNPLAPHYRPGHSPLPRYLPSDVNITQMHEDFCEKYPERNISYSLYRSHVKKMNIPILRF